jgi:hypothetical protein
VDSERRVVLHFRRVLNGSSQMAHKAKGIGTAPSGVLKTTCHTVHLNLSYFIFVPMSLGCRLNCSYLYDKLPFGRQSTVRHLNHECGRSHLKKYRKTNDLIVLFSPHSIASRFDTTRATEREREREISSSQSQ